MTSPVYPLAVVIIIIPLMLLWRGFKPRWYHFLFFPALFIFLMATYDVLRVWWENVMFTDPWASTVFTFSIVLAMFLLWTSTLKEE